MYLHPSRLVSGMSACWPGILAICYHLAHFPSSLKKTKTTLPHTWLCLLHLPMQNGEDCCPTGLQHASFGRCSMLIWHERGKECSDFSRQHMFILVKLCKANTYEPVRVWKLNIFDIWTVVDVVSNVCNHKMSFHVLQAALLIPRVPQFDGISILATHIAPVKFIHVFIQHFWCMNVCFHLTTCYLHCRCKTLTPKGLEGVT